MSATNRGTVRGEQDFYETPDWLTKAIIPILRPYEPRRILEPACGKGAIVRVLETAFPEAIIDATDINTGCDFLDRRNHEPVYDLIVTNPPYRLALEFIKRGLELRRTEKSVVCMLLRVNFLQPKAAPPGCGNIRPRFTCHRDGRPLPEGPEPTQPYCWMVWDGLRPTVSILPTECAEGQGALFAA